MKRSFAILLFLCLSLIYIESRPSDDGTEQAADVSSGKANNSCLSHYHHLNFNIANIVYN